MTPRVLVSDKLSETAAQIFRDRGVDVDYEPDRGCDNDALLAAIPPYDDLVIRSATKEAVYKAWFPLTRRCLDFADVSVTAHLDGTFRPRLRVRGPRVAGVDLDGFNGRWVVGRSLVVAATSVGQCQAARTPTLAGAA
jgi:4'-phosphopantetheinyl transferase superfamily